MKKAVFSILAFLAANMAFAGAEEVKEVLRQKYPNTEITKVSESPISGLYEVVMGRNIAYTNESGRYLIFGHIFDMEAQKDLTAERLQEISAVDVRILNTNDAIKVVKGDGSRKLYVFSDPDCPFCKRLERETIAKLDNVTIYTFLYPLEELHPEAKRKAQAIWCAKDKARAWADYMIEGKLPSNGTECATPVDRNIELGKRLGINGTPTIILENGTMVPGAVPVSELERRMAKTGG